MRRIYTFFGGRKLFHGYLYVALILGYAWAKDADFLAVAGALAAGLGITAATVAYEDARRRP